MFVDTYTGEIRWDSKAEKSILQVNATDLDKDVQGEVHYSIVNGNTRVSFVFNIARNKPGVRNNHMSVISKALVWWTKKFIKKKL